MNLEMRSAIDPITDDIILQMRIPRLMTRTDGEFKWRVAQALILALTDKESKYAGADTLEGLNALLGVLR